MKYPKQVMDAARAMAREVAYKIDSFAARMVGEGRADAQLAPIWAEKLRHTFPKLIEKKYPDLPAANGEVCPVDSSVDPADLVWEYYQIDSGASWDWIDDDGSIMPSAYVKAQRFTGEMAAFAGAYGYTIPEMERAAKANVPLNQTKAAAMKRAHDRFCSEKWLFGDARKRIYGLLTHPNIPMMLAPAGVSTSRHYSLKTGDEILSDIVSMIDSVPERSLEQHHVVQVFMPAGMDRRLRSLYVAGTASGTVTYWERLMSLFSGDDTGQPKVVFKTLNECRADRRPTPDPFPFGGDLMFALPAPSVEDLAFIRARGITMLPPENVDLKVTIKAHAKIGGLKVVYPLSVVMMCFGDAP